MNSDEFLWRDASVSPLAATGGSLGTAGYPMMNVPYFTLPDTELCPGVASTDELRLRDSEVVGRLSLLRVPFWIKLLTYS